MRHNVKGNRQGAKHAKGGRRSLFLGVLGVLAVQLAAFSARAEELTAEQISDKALEHNAFGFENAVARFTLVVTGKGGDRSRDVEIRSKSSGALGRSLVRFHAPADVQGTGFLVVENDGREDDQYLYLPALAKVKRIGSTQRNQKFMGTDLTYADLESRNLRKGKSKRLADAVVNGNDCYVLETFPVDEEDSQYGKSITYVHKVSYVPLKVEFFDKKLAPLKTLVVHKLEQRDGTWVVIDSSIENIQSQSKTRFTLTQLDTKVKLSDDEFTERALVGG
jgi:hypothetical protein